MYWTVIPTIFYLGVRVAGLGPIYNSYITTKSISWKSQQYTTFALVGGGLVDSQRPISTSPFNINYFYTDARGRVAGILWPRSTSINIPSTIMRVRVAGRTLPTPTTSTITWVRVDVRNIPMSKLFTTSMITWGRVAGLKRTIYTPYLTWRKFKDFFFRNFVIIVRMVGRRMAGIMIPIS